MGFLDKLFIKKQQPSQPEKTGENQENGLEPEKITAETGNSTSPSDELSRREFLGRAGKTAGKLNSAAEQSPNTADDAASPLKQIDRRKFLKLGVVGAATIAAEACGASKTIKMLEGQLNKIEMDAIANFYNNIDAYRNEVADRLKNIRFINPKINYRLKTEAVKPARVEDINESPTYLKISLIADGNEIDHHALIVNKAEKQIIDKYIETKNSETNELTMINTREIKSSSESEIMSLAKELLEKNNLTEDEDYQIITTAAEETNIDHYKICRELAKKINQQFDFHYEGLIIFEPTADRQYYQISFRPKHGKDIYLGEINAKLASDPDQVSTKVEEYLEKYNAANETNGKQISYERSGPGETLELTKSEKKLHSELVGRAAFFTNLIQNRFQPAIQDSKFILEPAKEFIDQLRNNQDFKREPHDLLALSITDKEGFKQMISPEPLRSRGKIFEKDGAEIITAVHGCLENNKKDFPYQINDKTAATPENIAKEIAKRQEYLNQEINGWFKNITAKPIGKTVEISITNYLGRPNRKNEFIDKEQATLMIDNVAQSPAIRIPAGDLLAKNQYLRHAVQKILMSNKNRRAIDFNINLDYVLEELKEKDPRKHKDYQKTTNNGENIKFKDNQILVRSFWMTQTFRVDKGTSNVEITKIDPDSKEINITLTNEFNEIPGKNIQDIIITNNFTNYKLIDR